MTIVTLHPVVVHLEGVLRGLLVVNEYLAILHLQLIAFVGTDGAFVDGQILQCQVDGCALLRNPDGAVVVARPVHVAIQRIDVQRATVPIQRDALHDVSTLLQLIDSMVGQRHITLRVEAGQVFHRDAQLLHQVIVETLLQLDMIGILHVVRLFVGLAVEIDDVVLDLQCLTRQTHTTLHIVLATICWTSVNDTILLRVLLNSLLTCLIDGLKVARQLFLCQRVRVRTLRIELITNLVAHLIVVVSLILGCREQLPLYFNTIYQAGKQAIEQNSQEYGVIDTRPTDRRENYVKRCVGLPGQTLQIKDHIIYLDGKANKEPDNVQYTYHVKLKQRFDDDLMKELGITMEDLTSLNTQGYMPLTNHAVSELKKRTDLVESITLNRDSSELDIYPLNGNMHWTRDNYGPIWIPKKGATIDLTLKNLPIYERPIRTYEGNKLEVKNGKIFINDKETTKYTFKMDYYWMQGDNRHNSLDSRYWGFVPEDHIVGKPIFIWWSSDPDRRGFSGIRWSRLFRFVDNIK